MLNVIKSRKFNLMAIVSMVLMMSLTIPAFAAPPTGVQAQQATASVATVALGKVLQLEEKVKELARLRRIGNNRNAARMARLEKEIAQTKRDNCNSAQDYRLCLDKQDEIERMTIKSFQDLMSGCHDEPGEVTADGVTVGAKRVCPDGAGIIGGKVQGSLKMTVVRTPGGSVITTQDWSSPPALVGANVANVKLDDTSFNWVKFGAMTGGCLLGAVGGGFAGNAIGGSIWRDQITVRADGQKEVIHGGADATAAISAVAMCGVGAFGGWLATK